MNNEENWQVCVKDDRGCGSWEISVVNKDFEHGFESYGWFGENKIRISDNGGPEHSLIPNYVFEQNIFLANEVAKALNGGISFKEIMES